ncbi:Uncharacterized protein APZ42_006039, partial [Daphnia magna]
MDNPQNTNKFWQFARNMMGGNIKQPNTSPIKDKEGNQTTNPTEKAKILLDQFCPANEHRGNELEELYRQKIEDAIQNDHPHQLNTAISEVELIRCLKVQTSKAMGNDRIHNKMLNNLNSTNIKSLLHLLNTLLKHGHVP